MKKKIFHKKPSVTWVKKPLFLALVVLVLSFASLAFAGYKYGIGPFAALVAQRVSINVILSDTPEVNAVAAANRTAAALKNNTSMSAQDKATVINNAAKLAVKQTIQMVSQQTGQSVTSVINDMVETPVDSTKPISQQISDATTAVTSTQTVTQAVNQIFSNSGISAPTTSGSGTCATAGSPVKAGTWVASGYGYRGNDGKGTDGAGKVDNNKRECRKCVSDGQGGTKYSDYAACDTLVASGADVILPPDAGSQYILGTSTNTYPNGTPFKFIDHPCFADGVQYGTGGKNAAGNYCLDGGWQSQTDFNKNISSHCSAIGLVASNGKCQVPSNNNNPSQNAPTTPDNRSQAQKDCDSHHATWDSANNRCAITTETYCNAVGGYWVNNECTFTKPVTTSTLTSSDCHTQHPGYLFVNGKCLPNTVANQALYSQANHCQSGFQKLSGVDTFVTCSPIGLPSYKFCTGGKFDTAGNCTPTTPTTLDSQSPVNSNQAPSFSPINTIVTDPNQCQFPDPQPDGKYRCAGSLSASKGSTQNYLKVGSTTKIANQCQNATFIGGTDNLFRCDSVPPAPPTGANAADAGSTNFDSSGSTVDLPNAPTSQAPVTQPVFSAVSWGVGTTATCLGVSAVAGALSAGVGWLAIPGCLLLGGGVGSATYTYLNNNQTSQTQVVAPPHAN